MPILTIEELTTPLSRQDVQKGIYEVLAVIGVDTTVWKPDGVVPAAITAVAAVISACTQLTADIAKSGFLGKSEGDWLALVAKYVFGVDKDEATFAAGAITLTNAGGGVFHFDPGDLVVANTDTGKEYRNTNTGDLAALGTLTLEILAVEAGSDSNASINQIRTLVTSLSQVTCTNPLALVATDEETDPALRTRCSEKLGSLSPNGPWDAYAFAARNAVRADGSKVGVNRVRITKDGAGNVDVYCATAAGIVPGTVGDLLTDLGAVDDAIQRRAAPLAVTANTHSATVVIVDVTYELWMYNTSGFTQAQVQQLVSDRLLKTFFPAQPVGGNFIAPGPGKLFLELIKSAIAGVLPEIFHVVVTLPASDVALAISDVAALGTLVATNINQVPPSEGFL